MASRVRRAKLALAVCVLVVTFSLTLAGIILVLRQLLDDSAMGAPTAGHVRALQDRLLRPAALDRQWISYSIKSTCADRSGGDGVAAVRLNSRQLAWFFSDSSLGPAGPKIGFSQQSGFVHNLVVVQTMRGGHSRLVTVTGGHACPRRGEPGHAVSVVRVENAGGAAKQRYWGADGLRLGSHVLRFYNRFEPGRVPFVPVGTVIADFPVSRLAHAGHGPRYGAVIRPHITKVRSYTPYGSGTPIIWGSALLQHNGKVYIYGWRSPDPASAVRECYLARVDRSRLLDISAWQFFEGAGRWSAGQAGARPIATSPDLNIDTGFSVISASHRYWLIQHSGGLGSAQIEAYPAPRPWGPFSTTSAKLLYNAPGIGLTQRDRYRIMYEARVEPALSTKHKLMISYNVNSLAVTAACVSITQFTNTVIQPHFVTIPRAVFRGASPGTADVAAVAAAPRDYPATAGDGRRWYDSWKYPGGCPPR